MTNRTVEKIVIIKKYLLHLNKKYKGEINE